MTPLTQERISRFASLYGQMAPRLLLALRGRFGLEIDLVEVIDEILVQFLNQIDESGDTLLTFEKLPEVELRRYLVVVLRNKCIDHIRRRETTERNNVELLQILQPSATIESEASRQELILRLHQAIEILNPPYRELFTAILENDTTLAELARKRGIKRGTIYTQFQRGLDELRKAFSNPTNEP